LIRQFLTQMLSPIVFIQGIIAGLVANLIFLGATNKFSLDEVNTSTIIYIGLGSLIVWVVIGSIFKILDSLKKIPESQNNSNQDTVKIYNSPNGINIDVNESTNTTIILNQSGLQNNRQPIPEMGNVPQFNLFWQGWCFAKDLPRQPGLYCIWEAKITIVRGGFREIDINDANLVYIGRSKELLSRGKMQERRLGTSSSSKSYVFTYVLQPTTLIDITWWYSLENALISRLKPSKNLIINSKHLEYHYTRGIIVKNTGVTFDSLPKEFEVQGPNMVN